MKSIIASEKNLLQDKSESHLFVTLFILLLAKAFVLFLLIASGYIPLAPDEAQYWTWSKALDFGYYSKPPAIAWQISLTTFFWGNNEIGVRFGALLIGILFPLAVYKLSSSLQFSNRISFWSALIAAFSPLGIYLSFAATTDGGALLFYTLALGLVFRAIHDEKFPNPYLLGSLLALGALYKWNSLFFWPIILYLLPLSKALRSWKLLGVLCISLCAFIPSLYWNLSHDFATFRHVTKAVVEHQKSGNFFDFLAAQMALLSPIFFGLFVLGFLKAFKNKALFAIALASSGLMIYLGMAFFKKMQPNWAALFFPPAFVLAAWQADQLKPFWRRSGIFLSIFGLCVALSIPLIQTSPIGSKLSYKANPFRQSVGNQGLQNILRENDYDPSRDFLFSDKYQVASLLSFYGPSQKRAYTFNISGMRKTQFSYWSAISCEKGKKGFFCTIENKEPDVHEAYAASYFQKLSPYFNKINFKGAFPLFEVDGKGVKYAFIFECLGYSGLMPLDKNCY